MKNLFACVALFFLMTTSLVQAQDAVAPAPGYKPGDKAESFSLMNVDGKMVSPENFPDAKGFVVVFTCNHCPFSVAYEDRIIALDQNWKAKGFPVLALNPNDPEIQPEDSFDNMKKRAKNKKFSFPYLLDAKGEMARKYGATKTPHVFVLVKEGSELKVAYVGAIDDNSRSASDVKEKYVENALTQILAGQPVAVPVTKAIGCSIKLPK